MKRIEIVIHIKSGETHPWSEFQAIRDGTLVIASGIAANPGDAQARVHRALSEYFADLNNLYEQLGPGFDPKG